MTALLLVGLLAGVLDLNVATVSELDGLPGIGRKKAEAIVSFRDKHPFRRSTEVMRVKGIGPKLYARLKDGVCAGTGCTAPPTARAPNDAPHKE